MDSAADTVFTDWTKMIAEVNIILDQLTAELRQRKQAYSQLNAHFGFLTRLPVVDAAVITSQAQKPFESSSLQLLRTSQASVPSPL